MNGRDGAEHGEACMCPPCLLLDMEEFRADQGDDVSQFWADVPASAPVWAKMAPVELERIRWGMAPGSGSAGPAGADAAGQEAVPVVRVPLAYVGVGVWARFSGCDARGAVTTVSGAVIGGPERAGHGWAVAIRDYRGNPDVVLYCAEDAMADLVDDPADYAAQAAHAAAPVFARGAERVDWVRREGEVWVLDDPPSFDVSAEQLAEWERYGCDPDRPWRRLHAVHRPHVPIPLGMR